MMIVDSDVYRLEYILLLVDKNVIKRDVTLIDNHVNTSKFKQVTN